jgi:hypothetical protein
LKLGFLGTDIKAKKTVLIDGGNEPYMTITRAQIGRAVAGILEHKEEVRNRYLMVNSWTTTQNEVLAVCGKVLGRFEVEDVSAEKRLEEGKQMLVKGDFRGIGRMWNFWCHAHGRGHVVGEERLANRLLGLGEEDMETVVREVVAELGISQ